MMVDEAGSTANVGGIADGIREAVASVDLKAIGEFGASMANLALANAVAHQQAMNQVMQAVTGRAVDRVLDTKIDDAAAWTKLASGNDLAQQLGQLGAAIASIQQTVKAGQTTPPATG